MATDAKDLHCGERSVSDADSELDSGRVPGGVSKGDPFPDTVLDQTPAPVVTDATKATEALVGLTANGTKRVLAPKPKKKKAKKKKVENVPPAPQPQVRAMNRL
jgi:hypothetical protein